MSASVHQPAAAFPLSASGNSSLLHPGHVPVQERYPDAAPVVQTGYGMNADATAQAEAISSGYMMPGTPTPVGTASQQPSAPTPSTARPSLSPRGMPSASLSESPASNPTAPSTIWIASQSLQWGTDQIVRLFAGMREERDKLREENQTMSGENEKMRRDSDKLRDELEKIREENKILREESARRDAQERKRSVERAACSALAPGGAFGSADSIWPLMLTIN